MKNLLMLTLISFAIIACDNNDDTQTNPQNPADGFQTGNTFYETPNAYICIDQADRDNDNHPDYYTFFFTDGRITDTYGDLGIGFAYAYSTNTTRLVKLQIFESDNPSLTTGPLTAGNTYQVSTGFTPIINGLGVTKAGFSKDSFISYNLQPGTTVYGTENGFDFTGMPEVIGIWHYPGNTPPTITIQTINIDNNNPANSTISVDYSFTDSFGTTFTGHYEGTLGIILD